MEYFLPKKYSHLRRKEPGPYQQALAAFKEKGEPPKQKPEAPLTSFQIQKMKAEKAKLTKKVEKVDLDHVEWNKDSKNTYRDRRKRSKEPEGTPGEDQEDSEAKSLPSNSK
jgi:hypothetical protein